MSYSTKLKRCPYCEQGVLRRTYGIRASIEECTICDTYLCVDHNSRIANTKAGQPLYEHTPIRSESDELFKNKILKTGERDIREIEIHGIQFRIDVEKTETTEDFIVKIKKEMENLTNEIAYNLAIKLKQEGETT